MILQYDEGRFPRLSEFRRACLDMDIETMAQIIASRPGWYADENPAELPLLELAMTFRAQHYASENDTIALAALLDQAPELLARPWTTQAWLPLTQAAGAGHDDAVDLLLARGADPRTEVGDAGDRANAVQMAAMGGFKQLAERLADAVHALDALEP